MCWFWWYNILCVIVLSNTTIHGDCGESCCVDYYREQGTNLCLPCIGSFGTNCTFPCPDGFYGFGCRIPCDCNDTEKCDPKIGCSLSKNQSSCIGSFYCNGTEDCDVVMGCIAKKDYKEDNTSHGLTLEPEHIILTIATFCFLTLFSGLGLYCVKRKRRLQHKHEDLIYRNAASESQINERTIPKECTSKFTEMEVMSKSGYPSMTLGRWDQRKPRHQKVGHNQLNIHATLPVGFTAKSPGSAATKQSSETDAELRNMTTIMYKFTEEGNECCGYPNQGGRKTRASQVYSTIKNN